MPSYIAPVEDMMFLFNKLRNNKKYNEIEKYKEVNSELVKDILEDLDNSGISIELIDLRSLMPWDKELVYESVKKTNKALIVHEANQTGGIGAEISASIHQDLFEHLDAPVERLGSIDIPTPFNQELEQEVFWPKSCILNTIKKALHYKSILIKKCNIMKNKMKEFYLNKFSDKLYYSIYEDLIDN